MLDAKTEAWGINVNSIEIRDISVPDSLRDALSKQAQAERERQSRTILGQAELEIAQKFAEAAKAYADNPIALQLRAMNIVYEGIRAGGSMMIVPSSVLDTMNLGGLVALGAEAESARRNGGRRDGREVPRNRETPVRNAGDAGRPAAERGNVRGRARRTRQERLS